MSVKVLDTVRGNVGNGWEQPAPEEGNSLTLSILVLGQDPACPRSVIWLPAGWDTGPP